jgi:type IV pilus assembly protein PilC
MAQVAPAQQFPFVWEGTDKKGKRIKGKMLGVSEAAVKADLRRQGVLAKRVRKEVQLFKSGKKITSEDIALFARQLATMLQAGIPMVQCFDIIGNGHEKPAMRHRRCRSWCSRSRPRWRRAPRCTRRWPSIRCTSTTCS